MAHPNVAWARTFDIVTYHLSRDYGQILSSCVLTAINSDHSLSQPSVCMALAVIGHLSVQN